MTRIMERNIIKGISKILKREFTNLSVEKVLDISIDILNEVEKYGNIEERLSGFAEP
jgi:hypothetical protein